VGGENSCVEEQHPNNMAAIRNGGYIKKTLDNKLSYQNKYNEYE
jgi:hypothetical protein